MADLLGAASRIDDAARALDRVVANADPGLRGVQDLRIPEALSDTSTQLAAAMPNGLANEFRAFYLPYDVNVQQLATVRSQLAHMGAVTRAVHELGGVDHVVSQGGLDAIDGAADVIRRHLRLDASDQMTSAAAVIDERPFGVSMSRKARAEHLGNVRRAITAPIVQLTDAGLIGSSGDELVKRLGGLGYSVTKDQYDTVLRDARSMVDQVQNANPATLPGPTAAWTERVLVSDRARAISAETAARGSLPVAPRLTTLADDAAVLANAHAALDQHSATFEALQIAVGSSTPYDAAFREAFHAAHPKLVRASEDVTRLEQLVADAPDALRDTGFLARDWVTHATKVADKSARYRFHGDTNVIPASLEHIRALQAGLAAAVDEPELLRAGTDIADELKEVLARPGARMDLAVVRSLFDGDTGLRAKTALVDHLPSTKPHPTDAPRTADVQESLQLLDETLIIGEAIKEQAAKGRWVAAERLLVEPDLKAATSELLARADSALGTGALVSERTNGELAGSVARLRSKLAETGEDNYARARLYDLESTLETVRTFRTELATRAERAAADGGLRAISPSARPAQAVEARSRWLLRELDSLTSPGTDATSAEHIDDAARRATVIHDLLRVAKATPDDGQRQTLMARAMTEYQSLGETWRMPDDVALDVWRIRDEIQRTGTLNVARQLNTTLPGYNTNPGMNRASNIASGLQSWSMFTDGPLPETVADRLSVAARRTALVRSYLDEMAAAKGDAVAGVRFEDQVDELRRRVAFVDDIADGAVPSDVRNRLDELFSPLDAEAERRAAVFAKYGKPGGPPEATWSGRPRLEEWITALEDAHRSAQASVSEQLTW